MGRTIARLAMADPGFRLVGGLDRQGADAVADGFNEITTIDQAGPLLEEADVIVDFSAPAFLRELLGRGRDALSGKALVVGTTGLGSEEEAALREASNRTAVLTAANFSLGVNLVAALVERTAAALGPDFDVEIVEAHHRRKEDAPSGTALALGEAVAVGRGVELSDVRRDGRSGRPGARPHGEIGFHAVRGGEIVGEHQVLFIGDHERIELTHRATDRALFAEGALRSAQWIVNRHPGRYTIRDVLGL
jgi:4-hydroxy-tetrahydrodipicolinate reductase